MDDDRPLKTFFGSDGFLYTVISGDLSAERLQLLKEDVERANAFIRSEAEKSHRTFKAMVDLAGFSGVYTPDAMLVLAAYEKENAPYIEKTAGFGGKEHVQFAGEIVSALSKRTNISFFENKEQAAAWLNA